MNQLTAHPSDFEPALIGPRTYTTRRRFSRVDVAALLSLMICLLYLFPARLIVPGLTGNGRPAMVVALTLCCWWFLVRLNPRLVMVGPQPLRWAVMAYGISLLLSVVAGLLRGLPTLEANGQDLAMIGTAQFVGVVLIAADGIPNWHRLRGVLRVMAGCGGFMALVGLVQSVLHIDVTTYLVLPGLQLHGELIGFESRGAGFYRVSGTATHYIEFSAVLATVLPFAIHFARYATERRHRRLFLLAALLIGAAIPVALSRTGIVALAVVLLVMPLAWGWRMSVNVAGLGLAVVSAFMVAKPGLLGTLRSLFMVDANDPSIAGRLGDFELVEHWYGERPWLGRGPGTLVPEVYGGLVLDNEWLYTLVTQGIVGVAALAGLHITCIILAAIALRRSGTAEDRQLCAALIAAVLISIVVGGTFDSLGFSTYALTLAVLMGICGTVWRFTHPARTVRTSTVRRFAD